VAESLTSKPITFLPSHLHYDHVGNGITFDRIALMDVPAVRSRAAGDTFSPSDRQHLGFLENMDPPTWQVDEWIAPGSEIDLGNRILKVYYTPGHTNDSISLFDISNDLVFSGDYLYPGPLYGFLPNSSMHEYLATTGPLIDDLPDNIIFYGAHRDTPPGAPTLGYGDLEDLRDALIRLKSRELKGQGVYPQSFMINDRLQLIAEPRWLQDWGK
jgi:glyoxylase-like metal-dependent hydrolase (beta-lactamase superfamily II)